ncbi:NADH-quinone oxidoreductase subunit NuoG [Magnetofaba australis]|uniref:NADH-quinone oxidoreductase n=1 Tax=Magnetofaba australis IT-1 TaxID=1434232 RepID=A0A1Y2K891_9PROT|nr:NADH-quinone oxidoreductase subunit NuoG [Magnetofaba australis]OSM06222.1 putative NADH-quinone oxidoreductase subunit G [Magnetofaba australis IT-1]
MPTLIIDNQEISVQAGATIMDAARKLGVYIPHFCYHPKLSIAGSCRMCLVEVEKMPKPVASCAMPAGDGMVVKTNSPMVQEARRGVMEFLLINHPLDCPVCDEGGNCDLQDLAMGYGPDRARFHETKREPVNIDIGPLIETEMDRCIHCTRCIRFSTEVAGVEQMGATYRGDHMSVGTFVEASLETELAGNLAQICPVGALNDKPFHFKARSWELKSKEGVCTHCAVGCHLKLDYDQNAIKRVQGAPCESINEGWTCDKGRFAFDGLTQGRLAAPMIKGEEKADWQGALDRAAEILKGVKPEEVAGLAAEDHTAGEELFAFQDFLRHSVGTPHMDHRLRQRDFSGDDAGLTRADLFMNTPIAQLQDADCIVLVGANTRYEAPILNLRLRKAARAGAKSFAIGPRNQDMALPKLQSLTVAPGGEAAKLAEVLAALGGSGSGDAGAVAEALKGAERPVLILGEGAINHPQAEALRRTAVAILDKLGKLGGEWNGYNRVSARAGACAAQDLGVVPHRGPGYARAQHSGMNARQILQAAADGQIKVLFLLGSDPLTEAADVNLARAALEKAQVISLGAFENASTALADVCLAGQSNREKSVTVTNAEGRARRSPAVVSAPAEAKEDWRVLRALSDRFSKPLGYNTVEALREAMAKADLRYNLEVLSDCDVTRACDHKPVTTGLPAIEATAPVSGSGYALALEAPFYRGDAVARNSSVMAELDGGNLLYINPADAAKLKLAEGGRVRVIQGDRSIEAAAKAQADVPAGVVVGMLGTGETPIQSLCDWDGGFPAVSLTAI